MTKKSVYPRWRGEHDILRDVETTSVGLSPLARGTHVQWHSQIYAGRFIPAGAGNTDNHLTYFRTSPVYPRWRGEHKLCDIYRTVNAGLSPLARGTRAYVYRNIEGNRFIPAGAGNTQYAPARRQITAVYPRWRGEHTKHTYLFL